MNSVILSQLVIETPSLSMFFLFNVFCTFLVAALCLLRFLKSEYVLARLSFCFALFIFVFYQVPLVLFSAQVEASLQYYWFYAFTVNAGSVLLVLWGVFSRRLDVNQDVVFYSVQQLRIYLLTLFIGCVCLVVYLSGVPWTCTGLFALMFDPWLTLLAREFGVKLIGSGFSTYLLGAYANAVAPILVLLSVWLIREALLQRRVLNGIVGMLGGVFAITAVLVSGTKGLLIPSMLMLVVGCYFWCRTWSSRIVTIVFAVVFVISTLVSFELLKERGTNVGGAYDFAACSVEVGTCHQSRELLESMTARDYSLGLPGAFVKPLQARLDCLCAGGDDTSCPSAVLNGSIMERVDKHERSLTFISAIFNRMLVVPFQVSIWNFMYAESEQVDGLKTLPFARRLLGESLNMPELVYQKYGSVYSGGDRTSTSTAPTSFFLAYPAYLGFGGFLLALALVIALDLFLAKLARVVCMSLVPLLVGAVLIMCMNFMTSDFITVLISHGGVAGIIMLLIHALLLKRVS
ncbi:MAG: hypothetical protein Q7J43_00060 [Pseudomonas sp.]|uniref:hypothetical protein n=1 Tax=Pseudomonas sp. TaxID=306 RepID=UPI002724C749|nr:hypothetical protein [Pseudomonas sp.]MDO9616054.1 hypothetical protein [Pseudomonas sp.]MDP2446225.1 hypothetical protein [Pseudomonas sp.]